ncbi:MAG: helix-turn-helix domain-containing protein [Treponema sp.]|nr:helix-turn-helix domain-containing protein [Candidatus Treponema scatequi]
MKEIIKYLRTVNSFTQDDVAQKLGIARQSYIKYENGSVVPPAKTVQRLAEIYGVTESFIYENKVPSYSNKSSENVRIYDAYFDGTAVRVLDDDFSFSKGQRFKVVVDADEDKEKRRQKSYNFLKKIIDEKPFKIEFSDDDPYYKKAIGKAKEEKYGFTD